MRNKKVPTFRSWLKRYYQEEYRYKGTDEIIICDLAEDAFGYGETRAETKYLDNTYSAWDNYLSLRQACQEARGTLKTAWQKYKTEVGITKWETLARARRKLLKNKKKEVAMSLRKNENWVLEYSRVFASRNLFPYHITTKESSVKSGEGVGNWVIVQEGAPDKVWSRYEMEVNSYDFVSRSRVITKNFKKNSLRNANKHLYFVQCGKFVKIGVAKDVNERMRSLSTGAPEPLKLVASFPNAGNKEKELHKSFFHLKVNGEWFMYTDEIKETIESLKNSVI